MPINISNITKNWKKDASAKWCIAPAGLDWIEGRSRICVGKDCIIGDNCKIGRDCIFGDHYTLGSNCIIGIGCTIDSSCSLGDYCIVGDYTRINRCCKIRPNCKIGPYCNIQAFSRIWGNCQIGDGCKLGELCVIYSGCTLGEGCVIEKSCIIGEKCKLLKRTNLGSHICVGANATDVIDLGLVEGFRKCIASVDGVAYIGSGCRWFCLRDAIEHWKDRRDRSLTRAIMKAAEEIARIKQWSYY